MLGKREVMSQIITCSKHVDEVDVDDKKDQRGLVKTRTVIVCVRVQSRSTKKSQAEEEIREWESGRKKDLLVGWIAIGLELHGVRISVEGEGVEGERLGEYYADAIKRAQGWKAVRLVPPFGHTFWIVECTARDRPQPSITDILEVEEREGEKIRLRFCQAVLV
ncbi:hypothetical protein C8R42DRAFT_644015 [Lentinula raphanica]|nr:hypothetical protein C8R42DRAFT_644015 [Lentinula raphanica]